MSVFGWLSSGAKNGVLFGSKQSAAKRIPDTSEKAQRMQSLTPREREAFEALVRGYTLAQTAELLGVRYPTANTHATHLYKKLGVNSKPELIIAYGEFAQSLPVPDASP